MIDTTLKMNNALEPQKPRTQSPPCFKEPSHTTIDSDANYSNDALQEFFEGTDAKIDDPDLIHRKALLLKQNPMTLTNQLVSKWRVYGAQLSLNDCFETRDPKTMRSVWHVKVGIPDKSLFAQGSHMQKAQARFIAS